MDTALPAFPARPPQDSTKEGGIKGLLSVLALRVTARFYGTVVQETFTRRGRALEIGPHGAVDVPAPEGDAFVVRTAWRKADEIAVVDARGARYVVRPDAPLALVVGDVELELALVRQVWVPRWEGLPWGMSLGWLAVLIVATAAVESVGAARDVRDQYECVFLTKVQSYSPVFAETYARDCAPKNGPGAATQISAEYIARLLREDYAGAERGVEPPIVGEGTKTESMYLPAGAKGPVTELGGAAEVSPEPVRSHGTGEELPTTDVIVAPLPSNTGKTADPAEANRVASGRPSPKEGEDGAPASEEKRGWGVQDWYDTEDANADQREISEMLQAANERLKIDPHDTTALSVLSYYQYLAEDFAKALDTYDEIIRLEPESSAGYNNKALVYKREGRYEEEEALYRVALALEPDDTTALNNLAVNLSHQHRFDEAQAIMNKLEVLDPDDAYADLHRAKIAAEQGQDDRARMFLEKALSGMKRLDTLHHIEFRQDIRIDPSFEKLRNDPQFNAILVQYYGKDTPLQE